MAVPAPATPTVTPEAETSLNPGRLVFRRFLRQRFGLPGLIIVLVVVLVAVLAPVLAPHPYGQIYSNRGLSADGGPLAPEGWGAFFPLGTDQVGRDVLSRLLWAARVSLEVGVFATGIAAALGTAIGLIAGYFRGWVDNVLMRFTDIMLGFPFLLFVILLVTLLSPSVTVIVVVIGVFGWTTLARLARGQTLSVRQQEYVEAARSLGATDSHIIWRHVFPNILAPVLVLATMSIAGNIIAESSLSFLGIGVPTPIPSWGKMVAEGLPYLATDPTLVLFPALAISITTIGFNLFGDALNAALNPRGEDLA
jgi:peptide/nickel transport system permease protein